MTQLPTKYKKMPTTTADEGDNINVLDEISLEEAIELIEAKRSKGTPPSRRGRSPSNKASGAGSAAASIGSRGKNQGTDGGARRNRSSSAMVDGKNSLLNKGDGGSPRPLSGFFRFCKDCREAQAHSQGLLDGDVNVTSGRSTLTVQKLSERWKALPDEGRARYNAEAAAAMAEWKAQRGCGGGKMSLEADLSTLS